MVDASFGMAERYQKDFSKEKVTYYVEVYRQPATPDYDQECWEEDEAFACYEDAVRRYRKLANSGEAVRIMDSGNMKEPVKESWPG